MRLIDGETSQPLSDVLVRLVYPYEHENRHATVEHYESRTDDKGKFFMTGLPDDDYKITFPEMNQTLSELPDVIRRLNNRDNGISPTDRRDLYYQAMEDYFAKPHYCLSLPEVKMTSGSLDLGTIPVPRVPTAEIEIKDIDGKPVLFTPFDLRFERIQFHYITGQDGKARVPLIGFQPGEKVYLCVPGLLQDRYQIRGLSQNSGKDEHPNFLMAQPQPGQTFRLNMIYHPTKFDVDLHLAFRDKSTGKPIEQVHGTIATMLGREGGERLFKTSGAQSVYSALYTESRSNRFGNAG